jgi:hypothetical protein
MKSLNAIVLVLSLLACRPLAGWSAEAPDWVVHSQDAPTHAVGIGMTKVDALAHALANLATARNAALSASAPDSKSGDGTKQAFVKDQFGLVSVTSLFKDVESDGNKKQEVSRSVQVKMKSAGKSFSIKTFAISTETLPVTKANGTDEGSIISIDSENMGFHDLVDELKRVGMSMEVYEDGQDFYVGLTSAPEKQ